LLSPPRPARKRNGAAPAATAAASRRSWGSRDSLHAAPTFQLTETEPRRGCRTIEVVGELDLAVADRLTEALNRAAEYPLVLVDLGNCDFVDSTGLAAFVHAHNSMKSEGRRFAIFGADHQVLRILSVTGLIEHDLVFESLEAALEADCSEA
jgi:anti-anti-sigma factor